MTPVFPITYLGPIAFYQQLLQLEKVSFEQHEHFIKQTYRNRCFIEVPNGISPLSIPVEKNSSKTAIKDVKISYKENWQKDHWKSIQSTYNASPFFEYYDYLFAPFYEKKETFLIDFNTQLLKLILTCLDHTLQIDFTSEYNPNPEADFRNAFNAKDPTEHVNKIPHYRQVFAGEREEFIPNLSIIDLLFNEGPQAKELLKL